MEIRYKRLFFSAQKTLETCKSMQQNGENFRILKMLGQKIDTVFAKNEISETYLFFPEPWDKKTRGKKHKIMTEEMLQKLSYITPS